MTSARPRPLRPVIVALLAAAVLAIAPLAASAATRTVTMGNNDFSPATVSVSRGTKVRWVNGSASHPSFLAHDVTSTAPARYFVSGAPEGIKPGKSWSFTFPSGGRFAYHCTVHAGMTGTIVVPIAVARLSSPVRFSITVASAAAAGRWRHEVQVRRPGATTWSTIRTTKDATVVFTPSRRGTYRFRSRVTDPGSGASSGWSASAVATD